MNVELDLELNEAFDKPLEFEQTQAGLPVYVFAEYTFKMNGVVHAVRFINGKVYGKKTSIVVFGKKIGKTVVKKFEGITNIRSYFATILAIFDEARENPTDKLKLKMDGFNLYIPDEMWEKGGKVFERLFKLKFRKQYAYSASYHDTIDEGISGFYFWKRGRTFTSVFDGVKNADDSVETVVDVSQDEIVTFTPVKAITKKIKAYKKPPAEVDAVPIGDTPIHITTIAQTKKANTKEPAADIFADIPAEAPTEYDDSHITGEAAQNLIRQYKGKFDFDMDEGTEDEQVIIALKNKFCNILEDLVLWGHFAPPSTELVPDKILTPREEMIVNTHIYNCLKVSDGAWGSSDKYISEKHSNFAAIRLSAYNISSSIKKWLHGYGIYLGDPPYSDEEKQSMVNSTTTSKLWELFMKDFKAGKIDVEPYFSSTSKVLAIDKIEVMGVYAYQVFASRKLVSTDEFNKSKSVCAKVVKLFDETVDIDSKSVAELVKQSLPLDGSHDDFYDDLVKTIPDASRPLESVQNPVTFKNKFMHTWYRDSGSDSQIVAHKAMNTFGVSKDLPMFWNFVDSKTSASQDPGRQFIARKAPKRTESVQSTLAEIYRYTQSVINPKNSTKLVKKLHRGVNVKDPKYYTPGVMESWSTSITSARRFSSKVLISRVPLYGVFSTTDALLKEDSPISDSTRSTVRSYLKEKEWMVLGGIFATAPVTYEANSVTIVTEWLLRENEEVDGERVKILTPADPLFWEIYQDKNQIAFGNSLEEYLGNKFGEKDEE